MKLLRVSIGSTALALVTLGATPASHGAITAGVCGLITRQEAAAALGAAVPAGAEKVWDFPLKGGSIKAQKGNRASSWMWVRRAVAARKS